MAARRPGDRRVARRQLCQDLPAPGRQGEANSAQRPALAPIARNRLTPATADAVSGHRGDTGQRQARSPRLRRRSAAARRLCDDAHAQAGADGADRLRRRPANASVAGISPGSNHVDQTAAERRCSGNRGVSRVYARSVMRWQAPHPPHFAALAAARRLGNAQRLNG